MASTTNRKGESLAELILESKFEELQALELLVIHLLEEFSSFKLNQIQVAASHPNSPLPPPPPPPKDFVPYVAKRSFKGSIEQLELFIQLKQACIYRIDDKDQIEQFKNEINEIKEKINKIKGMN